jgi:type II secretory pathway pseudopilin PulG
MGLCISPFFAILKALMNNLFIILILCVAVIVGFFVARNSSRVRRNEFTTLAEALAFKNVSTKYASGLVGDVRGKHALILSSVNDSGTIHIASSRMQMYLETDFPGDMETRDIEKALLDRVPTGMELRSGKSIFKGSALDLVLKESFGKIWDHLYLVAVPSDTTPEAILKRFNEMNDFAQTRI